MSAGNYSSKVGWEAISDTSSNLNAGPATVISAIAKEVGAEVS